LTGSFKYSVAVVVLKELVGIGLDTQGIKSIIDVSLDNPLHSSLLLVRPLMSLKSSKVSVSGTLCLLAVSVLGSICVVAIATAMNHSFESGLSVGSYALALAGVFLAVLTFLSAVL
jgi:hypothetical protein